jgi:hypothetical protein
MRGTRPVVFTSLFAVVAAGLPACFPPAGAAAAGKTDKLPHVSLDLKKKQVRVECEALRVDAPLEFFLCRAGTAEHEAVLRSKALPSHVHVALLAVGLKPGAPLTFVEETEKWIPPHGPRLNMTVEFENDGKTVSYPAYRWLLDVKTKQEAKAFHWVFTGSRVMPDGRYAADDTGYMVTLVNFDYAMIDVPDLVSSSNEALEWVPNTDLMPPKGTKVTLVIEPADKAAAGAATKPAAAGAGKASPTTKPANR